MNKSIRNLIIFTAATLGGGFLGIAVDRLNPPEDPLQGLGALIWLVTPLAAVLLLRALGGDGWQDFGLRFNLRSGWRWYLAAALSVPFGALLTLALGVLFGAVSPAGLTAPGFGAFLSLAGLAFASAAVKNVFEEFAWRGYLTPRLAAVKLNPFIGYLLTGFIWAGWHVPYYLYFLNRAVLQSHTSLSLDAFIGLAFILLPLQAIAYGELRLLSKSVWPAWLMHTVANAVGQAALLGGFMTLSGGLDVWLSPGPQGVVFSLLFGLIGLGMYRYRARGATHAGQLTRAEQLIFSRKSLE